jgi:hypothetical protein
VTLHRRFDPAQTLAAVAGERPSLAVLVPAQITAMLEHPLWPHTDLSSLRAITTGSQIVPAPLIEAATQLARARQRPCLLFIAPEIRRDCVPAVRDAIKDTAGKEVDLVIHSNGGDIHAAYVVAREIKRRCERVAVFVPLRAGSAATLLCLIGDELVLGSLGELGPLDGQYQPPQLTDASADTSGLIPFRALEQLNRSVAMMYECLVERFVGVVHPKASEACAQASQLTSAVFAPLYTQIHPRVLAENARGLELGMAHADRLLRRYRPRLPEAGRGELIDTLVNGYPCHCFPLDYEELGLPVRPPTPSEEAALEAIAVALSERKSEAERVITVVGAEAAAM